MQFLRYFRTPFLSDARTSELFEKLKPIIPGLERIETEKVFYVNSYRELRRQEIKILNWLLVNQHKQKELQKEPHLSKHNTMEIAPLLNFETADSTNAVSISHACTLSSINRLEQGRRYKFKISGGIDKAQSELEAKQEQILSIIHDKMTEGHYPEGLLSFLTDKQPEPVKYIPVLEEGMPALRKANIRYGTGMDDADLNYYHHLFVEVYKRNPTDVEFCDLGNAFSEHSRHHLFNAILIIDGVKVPFTLFEIIKATLKNKENSIIAFHDNGSAIKGRPLSLLLPSRPGFPSPARMVKLLYHYVLTCETHNHPCLIEAAAGAGTGGRGRVRDNNATGRGGIIGCGISGFMGGNLLYPGYFLPWENLSWLYDTTVESPLSFFTKATRGDFYPANEHGEPLGLFFAESYGFQIGKERWENIKPIMFTGGASFVDSRHVEKRVPQAGMLVIKIGGKAYRIGFGGGSASSMIHGTNIAQLDWDSVQRANGEMANKIDLAVATMTQMGDENPIDTIEDQGAGGPLNCIKELVNPAGAIIYVNRFPLGDKTLSKVEILVSEFQECIYFLILPENWELVKAVCDRLRCPCDNIGVVTGDGKVVVIDENNKTVCEDLELKHLFGDYPQKTFEDKRVKLPVKPLEIPPGLTVRQSLELTQRLLGVASREWLAHIVDRSVRTMLAQQMCVGQELLPINHYSIIAPSNWSYSGQVNAVGHRPPIGLIDPVANVQMTVADAMMGMMFAPISNRREIKASANWMLAAKLSGGLAWLYDAVIALKEFLEKVEVDINGGKDSLSLATKVPTREGDTEIIRSLNTLVFTLQSACSDFRYKVTPDIKRPGESRLAFIDLAKGQTRLGGSAFAQVLRQTGNNPPRVDDPELFCNFFDLAQVILRQNLILAGQKRVRGGILQSLLEMTYASNCGFQVNINHKTSSVHKALFNEEIGAVVEYLPEHEAHLFDHFSHCGISDYVHIIGSTTKEKKNVVSFNGQVVLDERMPKLRDIWRDTSYRMKEQHKTRITVSEERARLYDPVEPTVKLTFDPDLYRPVSVDYPGKIRVAVLEEEGCNSRIEMIDFVTAGGFEAWPITMTDIIEGRVSLSWFRGLCPVPGFSFKDVFGAGKGWAGVVKFNPQATQEFTDFIARPDTWSYCPCNAAQFALYLDIILNLGDEARIPLFIDNKSEGFESRLPYVRIFDSPAIAFRGMVGSIIPIHIDHGQGRLYSPDPKVIEMLIERNLAPIRFVDRYGNPTEAYPDNPNSSPYGVTGLVDPSGRHYVGMPHQERTHRKRHFHYWPKAWEAIKNSPWLRVMHNYRLWCESTNNLSVEPPRSLLKAV